MAEETEKKEKAVPLELPPVDFSDEDSQLRFTQTIRFHVAAGIAKADDIAQDHKAVNSLQKMLEGIDKQILGKRRVEAADKTAAGLGNIATELNQLVHQQFGTRPERHDTPPDNNYRPSIPVINAKKVKPEMLTESGEVVDVDDIMRAAFAKRKPTDDDELD